MKLQRGKFLVNSVNELDSIQIGADGLKRIIDLAYMGQFEYEGNVISVSRMFIEYYKDDYCFYPTQIFNRLGEQLYVYANSTLVNEQLGKNQNYISYLAQLNIERNFSLWDYVNKNPKECLYDFWWNVESDYFILFGEEKKDLVNYFIDTCLERDGGKEEVKMKLLKIGYKI